MSERTPKEAVFHFIAHTHWEGAVFKTRAEYLDIGLPNILRALRLLEQYPEYRFTLDQAAYIGPFLKRYPHERAALRRLVEEGRLAIVGGTDCMPDVNMPSGESFVRQLLLGKGFCRRELGVEVKTGWQLDTFGHHAQMPQLLRLAGIDSFWFFRGVSSWDVPAEFLWEGLDGTRVEAYWLPQGYAVAYGSPPEPAAFCRLMEERFALLDRQARGPDRAGPAGADVCAPEPHLPECVAAFNQRPDRPFRLQLAVPADFEAAVRRRGPERPVVTGELNPIFQGAYSSRIGLKQRLRSVETLLTTAEKQGAVLGCLGVETSAAPLWDAWEPALFNQAHDLMSGVMTDHVYADTVAGYEYSHRVAAAQVEARMEALAAQVDTRGPGIPLLVYNALGWERSDVVVADVGFGGAGDTGLALEDPEGRPVPVQILDAQRHADGSLLQARIAFVAVGVPAVGHAVYRLLPQPADAAAQPDAAMRPAAAGLPDPGAAGPPAGGLRWASEHYRVRIDPNTGALMSLALGADGPELLAGPANVIAVEEDHGDLWELYRPLDAGSRTAMRDRHPAPDPGNACLSSQLRGAAATWRCGPVLSEFELASGELGSARIGTRIRLYAGLSRIDIRTTVVNNERFRRYRALFPTCLQGVAAVHEIPFGAIERPDGVEFPAQNWIDYGDERHGLALLNRGLPGNNVADGTMMLSLLRAASIVAYGYGGGYEPGMSSESGHELGQEHTFEYSLVPHAGDWRAAGLWRHGLELNNPLLVRPVGVHAGPLPPRWGWLRVSAPTVVVSALKPGESGGVVLRLYEAAGRAATGVSVQLAAPVAAAAEADLLEAPGVACPVVDNGLRLDFRPFQIKTIRLEMGPWIPSM